MRNGIIFAVFVALLVCTLNPSANAQAGNNCWSWVDATSSSFWGDGGYSPLPPTVFYCVGVPGAFSVICKILTYQCSPPGALSETCPKCATAGSPISLNTGNTFIEETDVRLPGLSGGLTLGRTWNSLWPSTQTAYQIGIFGPNWRSTYEERVFVGSDNYMKYARSDGSFWSFGFAGGISYRVAAPANISASLAMGPSYWTLTFQNGEQRFFDNNSGRLIDIVDRNGNTIALSYDSLGRLVTVTDPASRHLYFGYGSSTYLVASVTSDFGESVSYTYDGQGRLSQVTEPDQSTLSFQYNSQSLIASVTDSNGKVLESHTYDSSGRGLTSSRANGVDAVSISYGTP